MARKQTVAERQWQLRQLVAEALSSAYVPTLLGSENDDLAADFDRVMEIVGCVKRAWRGARYEANRRAMQLKVDGVTL